MRERLTAAFVVVTLLVGITALSIRAFTVESYMRDHQKAELRHQAETLRVLIEQRIALRRPVDETFIASVIPGSYRVEISRPPRPPVIVDGEEYAEGEPHPELAVTVRVARGVMTVRESSVVVDQMVAADRRDLLLLAIVTAVLAGFGGWWLARVLAAPFRRLAAAAEALGRGRFELDLPKSKVPEVLAISEALRLSARRIQERLSHDRAFAEHASHVLRTPLTGLRLELEELSSRGDLPEEAQVAVNRALARIQGMDAVTGELVSLARSSSLVSGAEVPLRDLAQQCAQDWSDALAEDGRTFTATVAGDSETPYTPGPVEQVLDLLLSDVRRRSDGPVRMAFEVADDAHLRIRIVCAGDLRHPGRNADHRVGVSQARAVVSALGGRLEGDNPRDGLEVLLPCR